MVTVVGGKGKSMERAGFLERGVFLMLLFISSTS